MKSIFLFFVPIFFASNAVSQPGHKNLPPASPQFNFRPTARPDRMLLTWTSDPSNTQTITWRTDTTVEVAYAEITKASSSPGFHKNVDRYQAETSLLLNDFSSAAYHQVTFTQLQPATRYLYRVGSGDFWSEWISFETMSDGFKPYTFLYLGDAQNKLYSHWARVIREAYKEAPDASFILHAGDLVNHSQNDYEWGEWFEAGSFIHRILPTIATPGNHEYIKDLDGNKIGISPFWGAQFNFPKNGPGGLQDRCYFMDVLDTRIVTLDSNHDIELQAQWLEKTLKDNPNRWTLVTFHHPVVSAARGRVNEAVLMQWKPILDKYKVDLVLQGHDHTYARGQNLVTDTSPYEQEAGTVYVVSISGTKMYSLTDQLWMTRSAENTQLYQVINVFEDHLVYRSFTANGEVYDAFKLIKKGQGPNVLEELPKSVKDTHRFPSEIQE